jgi:FkbM family methyltransferase
MFGNCDTSTNGELRFYNKIKNNIDVIFDVGCRNDSSFLDFKGEVHYFDPCVEHINQLKHNDNANSKAYFNPFGLSSRTGDIYYYPKYESFYNRVNSCRISDEANKITLKVKNTAEYIEENNINNIDFVKIDTEGHEFEIIKSFGEYINNVKIIQFEYGGTYLDTGVKLEEVVNYLKEKNFDGFSYLIQSGLYAISDFRDHYNYCNIVCFNKNYDTAFAK